MFKFGTRNIFRVVKNSSKSVRQFSGGHDHHGPHVPEGYEKIGKCLLITCYLWIFYRLKQDKGQSFGLYQPWLEEHEHEEHVRFTQVLGEAPVAIEDEDDEDEDHDE